MIPDNWDPNEKLTGYANENGNSNMTPSDYSYVWSGNKQTHGEVIGNYTKDAYQNMEHSKIPDSMKDVVKDYFESMN